MRLHKELPAIVTTLHSNAAVKQPEEPWKFHHLNGARPEDHTEVRRGKNGKVLLTVGNVWVEHGQGSLWVLRHFEIRRPDSPYPHQVWLGRYRSLSHDLREMSETGFRARMMVWDDYGRLRLQ